MVRHNTIMDKENATRRAHDLMTTAEAVYLTTLDPDGWPNTRAMLNLRNTERYPGLVPVFTSYDLDCTLLFTTNTSSGKVSQITGNPRASAYFCNPSEWRGLMLGGEISVVADLNLKEGIWQENWRMYYPGGIEDPDYSILRMIPRIAKYYEYLDSYSWNPAVR